MKILERKVEVWLVALVAILGLLGMIVWGNIAVHAQKGGQKAGLVGDAILQLSSLPDLYERITSTRRYMQIGNQGRFEGQSGFSFSYPGGSKTDAGYLLLSRYSGDEHRSVVELVDLDSQTVVHRWTPDINAIHERAVDFYSPTIDLMRDKNQERMLIRHPYLTEQGEILFHSRTPMIKIDACSELVWQNDDQLYHHATERDADGVYWTSAVQYPPTIDRVDREKFLDDSIAGIDDAGKVRFLKSVSQVFLDNGLPHMVFGMHGYRDDPIHLNDVQPIDADGPYWKKGDLLLSLRDLSTIMLYRPSTNKIVWRKDGPWSLQHDVDILDDHRISVFNNNAGAFDGYETYMGPAEVMIYDFAADEVSSPWKAAMEQHEVLAGTESLAEVLPGGELFIEEQNFGRLLHLTGDGEVVWQYVNRAEDGLIYRLGWSRLLTDEFAEPIARRLAETDCEE